MNYLYWTFTINSGQIIAAVLIVSGLVLVIGALRKWFTL